MLIDRWEALKFFLPATAFIALGIEVLSVGPEHSEIRVYRHFHYGLNVAPL